MEVTRVPGVRGRGMRALQPAARRVLRAATALVCAGLVAGLAPAAEANATSSTPILVVHGYDLWNDGVDCRDASMTQWVNRLKSHGFTNVLTVGWYARSVNCDLRVPGVWDNSTYTSLTEVGREFANLVAQRFGSTTVAVSAHSMGGLVARAAVAGVQNQSYGWPTYIRISDVVTSGTPHAGTDWGYWCDDTQCIQIRPGSYFLNNLAHNPQTPGTTEWTLIGSEHDSVVSAQSATSMYQVSWSRPTVRRVVYPWWYWYSHSDLIDKYVPVSDINNGLRD